MFVEGNVIIEVQQGLRGLHIPLKPYRRAA